MARFSFSQRRGPESAVGQPGLRPVDLVSPVQLVKTLQHAGLPPIAKATPASHFAAAAHFLGTSPTERRFYSRKDSGRAPDPECEAGLRFGGSGRSDSTASQRSSGGRGLAVDGEVGSESHWTPAPKMSFARGSKPILAPNMCQRYTAIIAIIHPKGGKTAFIIS